MLIENIKIENIIYGLNEENYNNSIKELLVYEERYCKVVKILVCAAQRRIREKKYIVRAAYELSNRLNIDENVLRLMSYNENVLRLKYGIRMYMLLENKKCMKDIFMEDNVDEFIKYVNDDKKTASISNNFTGADNKIIQLTSLQLALLLGSYNIARQCMLLSSNEVKSDRVSMACAIVGGDERCVSLLKNKVREEDVDYYINVGIEFHRNDICKYFLENYNTGCSINTFRCEDVCNSEMFEVLLENGLVFPPPLSRNVKISIKEDVLERIKNGVVESYNIPFFYRLGTPSMVKYYLYSNEEFRYNYYLLYKYNFDYIGRSCISVENVMKYINEYVEIFGVEEIDVNTPIIHYRGYCVSLTNAYAMSGNVEKFIECVMLGGDCFGRDSCGMSTIHYVCCTPQFGSSSIITLLISCGVDINTQCASGLNCLEILSNKSPSCSSLADTLVKLGAHASPSTIKQFQTHTPPLLTHLYPHLFNY